MKWFGPNSILGEPLRFIFILVVAIILGWVAYRVERWLHKPENEAVYERLAAISYQTDLRLVEYWYEAIVPVEKFRRNQNRNAPLKFIVTVPVRVQGYVDLSQTVYEEGPDSVIRVILPPARLTEPVIYLDSIRDYSIRSNRSLISFRTASGSSSQRAFSEIQEALIETKQTVTKAATEAGVLQQTSRMAEVYLRGVLEQMGFRVEIQRPGDEELLRRMLLRELLNPKTLDSIPPQERLRILRDLRPPSPSEVEGSIRSRAFRSLF